MTPEELNDPKALCVCAHPATHHGIDLTWFNAPCGECGCQNFTVRACGSMKLWLATSQGCEGIEILRVIYADTVEEAVKICAMKDGCNIISFEAATENGKRLHQISNGEGEPEWLPTDEFIFREILPQSVSGEAKFGEGATFFLQWKE